MFSESGTDTALITANVPRSAAHCLAWAYRAPQPGMFWKRSLLKDGFEERWRYCFDHELYVRLLLDGRVCRHLSLPVAAYRLHENSKTVAEGSEFDHEFDAIAEIHERQLVEHGKDGAPLPDISALATVLAVRETSDWLQQIFFEHLLYIPRFDVFGAS